MFVHGINYISYENSNIIASLSKFMDSVIDQINLTQIKKEDYKFFDNFETISNINDNAKKEEFPSKLSKLTYYLNKIDSIIGVLDQKHPVHILYEKKVTADKIKKVKIVKTKKNLCERKSQLTHFGKPQLSHIFPQQENH